jgi:RNA polymerase-interacting CarD/CdnL/TRCF family regulator
VQPSGSSPNDEPSLSFAVGDVVVYAAYGIGRVLARRTDAKRDDLVVLEFSSGLTVTLPRARAHESMRPLSSEAELTRVEHVLRADETPTEQPWSKRFRVTREKVTAGEAIGLAEVVRDGLRREGNLAGQGTALSLSERELYLRARRLLAEEIGNARSLDPAEADRWIADQVARTPS